MMMSNGKYVENAEYYYNKHIDMYCIVGTTFCSADIVDLEEMFASPELLVEVEMPDYITGDDYDGIW